MQAMKDASPTTTSTTNAPSPLAIHVENHSYTFQPEQAPIIIGRESPAQVVVGGDLISRTHVHIEPGPHGWVALDRSKNGIFVDGARQDTITINDELTIHLGGPDGVPVRFGTPPPPQHAPATDLTQDDEGDVDSEVTDPGIAFAGAAVAARREELNVTQRGLARDKIINAGGLIAFEKGRRWPRPATRAKLEQQLQWPPGHINELRRQGANAVTQKLGPDNGDHSNSATVQTSLLTSAAELALTTIESAIAELPHPDAPDFSGRAAKLLGDLRRLEAVAADAAQTTKGAPDITLTLSAIRRRYRDLMLRAARAPGATLGQQLYAARHRNELSVEEIANAANVPVTAIEATEAEIAVDANTTAAIKAALNALNRRR